MANDLSLNLCAYWKFDDTSTGTAVNSLSTGNLTAYLGPRQDVSGLLGSAVQFDTSVSSFYNTSVRPFPGDVSEFAVSLWVYPDTSLSILGRSWQMIRSGTGPNSFSVQINGASNNTIAGYIYGLDASYLFINSNSNVIEAKKWNHVVVTWAVNSNPSTYVNNVNVTSSIQNSRTGNTATPTSIKMAIPNLQFNIGNGYAGNNLAGPGKIDEVGIWTRSLTAAEVSTLYNNRLGVTYPTFTTSASTYDSSIYYVDPSGNDTTGNGSISNPWFTLTKAWSEVSIGYTIYMRGGTYTYTAIQNLRNKSGTSDNYINILAYPGEQPILTRTANPMTPVSWPVALLRLSGCNYIKISGLEITGFTQDLSLGSICSGLVLYNSDECIVEKVVSHHNGHGVLVYECANTQLLYCDAHHNYDPLDPYGNDSYGDADGFEISDYGVGTWTIIRGCRSWNNSDDGFDLWDSEMGVTIEGCWSWNNGYRENEVSIGGDGNGFKLGRLGVIDGSTTFITKYDQHLRTIRNNVSWNNRSSGFNHNHADCIIHLYNNTSYNNPYGFLFFDFGSAIQQVKNNLSYDISVGPFHSYDNLTHNTFIYTGAVNSSYGVSIADFLSLNVSEAYSSRQSSGELPLIEFLHLATGSDLIYRGIDVSLLFDCDGNTWNNPPSLGAFEFSGSLTDLSTGLQSYWKLDETTGTTIYDSVGTNNMTSSGAVIAQTDAISGYSIQFDGSMDYLQDGTLVGMDTNNDEFSLSLWAKFDVLPASLGYNPAILRLQNNPAVYNAPVAYLNLRGFGDSYTYLAGYTYSVDTSQQSVETTTSKVTITTDKWYHIVYVYEGAGSIAKLYVDASDAVGWTNNKIFTQPVLSPSGGYITVANSYGGANIGTIGKIDEIGYWNRALTPTEVSTLYNNGLGVSYPTFTYTSPPAYTSYYVSNNGSDNYTGLSESTPWQTLSKVNSTTFSPGDHILFKRGDTFRGSLYQTENGDASNWIVYGAYGTGDRPKILGSKNLSATGDWTNHSGNVWKTTSTLGTNQGDISNIIFNDEASCGFKKKSLSDLTSQGRFFYNASDNLLYIYSTSNPASVYTNIEAAGHHDINQGLIKWANSSYITLQYLDVRYSSAAGIETTGCDHIIIEYCNVSWIGGEYLDPAGASLIRLGNGYSFVLNNDNIIVRNCTAHQCYDAGISPQAWSTGYSFTNMEFYNNVITKCYYSYEIWAEPTWTINNVHFYNNTCIAPGECWSNTVDQRPDYVNSCMVMMWALTGTVSNTTVRNNIFDGSCNVAMRLDDNVNKITVDYNLFNTQRVGYTNESTYYTTLPTWQAAMSQDAHSISSNPLFISTTDYHLQSTSPAINAGANTGITTDFDDNIRPINNLYDIGAYEYQGIIYALGYRMFNNTFVFYNGKIIGIF